MKKLSADQQAYFDARTAVEKHAFHYALCVVEARVDSAEDDAGIADVAVTCRDTSDVLEFCSITPEGFGEIVNYAVMTSPEHRAQDLSVGNVREVVDHFMSITFPTMVADFLPAAARLNSAEIGGRRWDLRNESKEREAADRADETPLTGGIAYAREDITRGPRRIPRGTMVSVVEYQDDGEYRIEDSRNAEFAFDAVPRAALWRIGDNADEDPR